jgi:hypothetical protein
MTSDEQEVQVLLRGTELLVDGNRTDIDLLLHRLSLPAEQARRGVATGAAEVGAIVAAGGAIASTSRELYQLTPEAMELIEEFGWAKNSAGDWSGVVRKGGSSIGGHLSFDQVSMGAEQAVALQTAAVAIALRSAIADVKNAIEEVDGKVEDLQRRARANEIGEVVGLCRELERMVQQTQQRGRLLSADWDSVGSVRRDLAIALERLRAYVTATVRSTPSSADLPDRVKAVEQFASAQSVAGSLQLIAVAEHALHLWHYLYVERVRSTDPDHVLEAVESARAVLKEHRRQDEEIVGLMLARVGELGDVRPLEIHRRFSIREMDDAMQSAHVAVEDFAERTRAPLPQLGERAAARPGLPEARQEIRTRAVVARDLTKDVSRGAARSVQEQARGRFDKVRHRRDPTNGEDS